MKGFFVTLLKYTAAAIALLPTAALCQTEESSSDNIIVVTATGIEQDRNETGQAISIITQEELARSQALTITEALKAVPGLSIAERGAYGSQSSAFIRGGNSSQTLVLIDGVRANDPSSPNGLFDFGGLTVGNMDRIEVLRGPNSIVWGSQAIGGIISIRNAEPTEALSVRARAEYGSYDTAAASANISGKFGIVSASLGGGYLTSDGVSALRAGTERDGYRNNSVNAKLSFAFTDAISLDLRGFYNRSKVEYDAQFSATPDTLSESRDRSLIGYAGLNVALFDGKFRNRLSYSRTDIDRVGTDPATPILFTNYNIYDFKGRLDRFEYQAVLDVAEPVTLIFGAEHEKSKASAFFPANGGTTADRATTSTTSFYGQAITRPINGLTLTGGLRHDDFKNFGKETSLGGNIAYSPNGGQTILRATYAEGFRAPTLTEALLPFGNIALQAETAKSFDLGVEQKLIDDRVRIAVTLFKRTSRNQITFSFLSFQSENIERVRAQGVEIELDIKPTDNLILAGSYSLVDVRDRSAGITFNNQLERRPRHNAALSLDWTTPIKLALGATVTLRGDSFEDRANTLPIDGYALAGIRASYPVTDAIEFYGRVENLFDAEYETVLGYGNLGRNAHIGIRARF
jgi:vitamin B12 transporter